MQNRNRGVDIENKCMDTKMGKEGGGIYWGIEIVYLYILLRYNLEKEMATHSSILAWRIPWMEEPGGLQSTGSQRVGHD